ncbi:hypothetical protein [Pseudarthrobacter siccitolerans]
MVRDLHEWVKVRPARGWTLALPLMMVGLAGCGGSSDAATPTQSGSTSSAPAESLLHQARHSCELDGTVFSDYAKLGDSGYTMTMMGAPADPTYADLIKVTGLRTTDFACVFTALEMPDSIVSQMDGTRALDGTQKASWDKFAASWTYHPDNGLRVILTESK